MALTGRRPAQIFFSATFSLPRKDEGLGGWSLPRGGCRTQPGVSTPGTSNQMDSPCKGVRSAVVTRVEYCMVTPFFWRPLQGASLSPSSSSSFVLGWGSRRFARMEEEEYMEKASGGTFARTIQNTDEDDSNTSNV